MNEGRILAIISSTLMLALFNFFLRIHRKDATQRQAVCEL